jgi:hypothetical protein
MLCRRQQERVVAEPRSRSRVVRLFAVNDNDNQMSRPGEKGSANRTETAQNGVKDSRAWQSH